MNEAGPLLLAFLHAWLQKHDRTHRHTNARTRSYLRPDAHVVVLRSQLEGEEEADKETDVGCHPEDLHEGVEAME